MKKAIGLIFLFIFLFVLAVLIYPVTVLQIVEEQSIIYQTFTKPHDRFTVRWIHSVSKQPIYETYEINEDLTIDVYEMIFNEPGPNLPSGPEGGTLWEISDGKFRVYNYNINLSEVPVRIGQIVADHTLVYKGKEIPMKDISRPGGFVKIRVCRMSVAEYFYKEVIIWLKKK